MAVAAAPAAHWPPAPLLLPRQEGSAIPRCQQVGRDVSSFLSGSYLSACDLSSALARVFSAVAEGHVKPRTASTLAYLARL